MSSENRGTNSRKWMITCHNPIEKGYTHDKFKLLIDSMTSVIYWCMSDEIGLKEHTFHTHIFIVFKSARHFDTMHNKFPQCNLDDCKGTPQQNRDYVFKDGKWKNDPKSDTNIVESHEEWGELPISRQGQRSDLALLRDMIKDGLSNYEIIEECPQYMLHTDKIDKTRQMYLEEKYKNVWRDVDVTYIWGVTGAGKTRSVKEKYGYSNVYTITDYQHPFDGYNGQDVILFEEFRSGIRISDMLQYLDGYPVELACRYANKVACFTKVFFCTNIDLREQYREIQMGCPETWSAFVRRVNRVQTYTAPGCYTIMETQAYLQERFHFFRNTPPQEAFESADAKTVEQIEMMFNGREEEE